MFKYADAFNSDVSNWNTRMVESIYEMFHHASSFDRDLSNWDVRKLVHMMDATNYAARNIFEHTSMLDCTKLRIFESWETRGFVYVHINQSINRRSVYH